jgi:intein/homing endonuclease
MISWPYLAGFFDGEGNVRNNRSDRSITPNAKFTQAGRRGLKVLNEIREFLSIEGIYSRVKTTRKGTPKWQECYDLLIERQDDVLKFLACVYPYLRVKRVEALDYLRFYKIFTSLAYNRTVMSEGQVARYARERHLGIGKYAHGIPRYSPSQNPEKRRKRNVS